MKPIEFKEHNTVFAKDQPEYLPLPAYREDGDKYGNVICCWQLSFKERIKILFTGKLWLSLMSFNNPLTPHRLTSNKWDLLNKEFFTPNPK
jgi:hypothetical protein